MKIAVKTFAYLQRIRY